MKRSFPRKKIALIIQRFGSGINGGAEVHAMQIAKRLSPYHDITVLTSRALHYTDWKPEWPEGESNENGIRILRFNHGLRGLPLKENIRYKFLKSVVGLLKLFKITKLKRKNSLLYGIEMEMDDLYVKRQGPYTRGLIEYVRAHKNNYDCFIFFTYLYFPTVYGIQEVPGKSILIPMIHDEPAVHRRIYEKVMSSARFIFFNTEAEKKFAEKRFELSGKETPVVATGISIDPTILNRNIALKYNIVSPFIMYLGRIEEGKGCKNLIEWHEDYCKRNPNAPALLMVGQNLLHTDSKGKAIFTGFISEEDKNALLSTCIAIVVPSEFESLSLCLLEAFCFGKPGIVNKKSEVLKSHIEESHAGWTFENKHEFENCLNELTQNPQQAIQYGLNGLKYVSKKYNWESIINTYLETINQIHT